MTASSRSGRRSRAWPRRAIAGANSTAKLATFDLNADVAKAVEDGKILFAVDQQPYLQGYIAVVMLTQYKANLNVLGGGSAGPDRP